MTYKELYNIIKQSTDNFTKESGNIGVTSRADRDNAYNILMKAYSDVKKEGLNFGATSEDEVNMYKLSYSGRLLDLPEEEYITVNEAMIEKHDKLNPKLWDSNNELRPEVREKIEEIVEKFKKGLEENEVKLDVEDVCLIGSNASYNYNPTSDVDLHIIADTSVYSDEDLALKTYLAYKSLFNDKYDPTIRGIEVEVYVEPNEVHANSKGIYSLEKGWLKEPEASDVPEVDEEEIADAAQPYIDRADELFDNGTVEEIDNLIDDIYLQRQQSIMKDGEFAKGNLIFKFIRSMGLLQDLRDKKIALENEKMSLEENDMDEFGLKDIFIEEDIEDDGPEMFELAKGQKYTLGPNHYIIIRDISGDHVSCSEVEDDEVYDYDESRLPLQTMLFEYDAKLEDELVEEVEEKSNGMTFKFPDVVDTLTVYLSWEGIEGFLNDILDFADVGEEALRAYLEDEGIYGYTYPIMNIIKGESAFCQGMDMSDFMAVCEDNFIDYTEAIEGDDITVTESKVNEDTVFDTMPGYMTPEEIRALEKEKADAAKAEKDAERAEKRRIAKEKAKDFKNRQKRLDQREKVNNLSYDSLADMAGLPEDNNDLTKDELLATLRASMSDEEILKLHKKMFEDLNESHKGYDLIFDRDTGDRQVEYGINWIQFTTDNYKDAVRWIRQLNAAMAGDLDKYKYPSEDPKYYDPENYPGDIQKLGDGKFNFRRPRDILDDIEQVDFVDADDWLKDAPTITYDEIDEAKKTGLVSAAKSVLNRLCKKYEDAFPEEIYSKALEVAGRSDSSFVKDILTAKKEETIKFINDNKEATNLGEAVDNLNEYNLSKSDIMRLKSVSNKIADDFKSGKDEDAIEDLIEKIEDIDVEFYYNEIVEIWESDDPFEDRVKLILNVIKKYTEGNAGSFSPNARLDIQTSDPELWGLDTKEEFEEEVGKYDGQVCEAECIIDNDTDDPADNYYNLEFADGYTMEGVSGLEIDFFADES